MKIPPHVSWPLFVILLLLAGMGGAFSMLLAAGSDGGAQVVDDYYRRAVAWDSTAAVRDRAAALGWRAELLVLSGAPLRVVELSILDVDGMPVEGLFATLQLSRPQQAASVAVIPFAETEGIYRLRAPITSSGLWDFVITARKDSIEYVTTIRRDVEL